MLQVWAAANMPKTCFAMLPVCLLVSSHKSKCHHNEPQSQCDTKPTLASSSFLTLSESASLVLSCCLSAVSICSCASNVAALAFVAFSSPATHHRILRYYITVSQVCSCQQTAQTHRTMDLLTILSSIDVAGVPITDGTPGAST